MSENSSDSRVGLAKFVGRWLLPVAAVGLGAPLAAGSTAAFLRHPSLEGAAMPAMALYALAFGGVALVARIRQAFEGERSSRAADVGVAALLLPFVILGLGLIGDRFAERLLPGRDIAGIVVRSSDHGLTLSETGGRGETTRLFFDCSLTKHGCRQASALDNLEPGQPVRAEAAGRYIIGLRTDSDILIEPRAERPSSLVFNALLLLFMLALAVAYAIWLGRVVGLLGPRRYVISDPAMFERYRGMMRGRR